jgi:hypothetical protein
MLFIIGIILVFKSHWILGTLCILISLTPSK